MYTILVVDDEKDIVSALEIYLKAEGYRVLSACNGKEALAAAAREDVHLILMDIMMPVMDGLSAMAQLRQTSNVPVILLTAKGEDTDKVLGLNVGADDYITKPFNPVELLARVRSQLRRYLQLGGGQDATAAFSAGLLGSLLGFLLYNKNPARVFMGDTGSLFLGGAVCGMAFACDLPLILVPVGLIYIVETLSDIIQVTYFKLTHGKRIFKMAPLHHHFEMCGWSEVKVVCVFTLISLIACMIAYLATGSFYCK